MKRLTKITRFLLAAFLWAHAIFALKLEPSYLVPAARWLHLSSTETLIACLLLIFSFVAGPTFWRGLGNVAYIYVFPFVLLGYAVVLFILALVRVARWLNLTVSGTEVTQGSLTQTELTTEKSTVSVPASQSRRHAREVLAVIGRPFHRFAILWGLLLLLAAHKSVLYLACAVLLMQIAADVFWVVRAVLASGPLFEKIAAGIHKAVGEVLEKIKIVTPDTPPSEELKNAWTTLRGYKLSMEALQNEPVVTRWAMLLLIALLGTFHLYLATLFSFAYCGIAHISGVSLRWVDSFVTSLFIPVLVGELPKIIWLKLLGGLQAVLVVSVTAGTAIKFFKRQVKPIQSVAAIIHVQLTDEKLREKYTILEAKFAPSPAAKSTPPTAATGTTA